MNQALMSGGINEIEANRVVYQKKERISSISFILKGTVEVRNSGFCLTLGPGKFVGITDVYLGVHTSTTVAITPCSLFVFEVEGIEDITRLLNKNKGYKGYLVKSLNTYLNAMEETFRQRKKVVSKVQLSLTGMLEEYQAIRSTYGGTFECHSALPKIQSYEKVFPTDEERMALIKEAAKIPDQVVTTYYSYLSDTAMKEIGEKIKIAMIARNRLDELSGYAKELYQVLYREEGDSLFTILCREAVQLAPSHPSYEELIGLIDDTIGLVDQLECLSRQTGGELRYENRKRMQDLYSELMLANTDTYAMEDLLKTEQIEEQLKDSLAQILGFGQVDDTTSDRMHQLVDEYLKHKDTTDSYETDRALRKELTALFFFVYRQVFLRAYEQKQFPKPVEMFLYFGYLDERLLSKHQLKQLASLSVRRPVTQYCQCYNMYDWLVMIYEGEKEPSVNEMNQDFRDQIRLLRQEGRITEEEAKQYSTDVLMKLDFELNHFFVNNMKLTNGMLSTFVPFLHEDSMAEYIEQFYVTANRIDEAMRDILSVDFSAFYQEVIFSDSKRGISKELLVEEHLPDIILFPTCGAKGVMWQDIENKRRASSGRFCIPVIHEGNLMDTMVKVVGRYRWEICRTLQGLSWNDIRNRCLTSEYSDYLQFYRRNKELSEEKKERVRQQLMKARNSTKECFVLDYENWIKYEAKASLRLNQVARNILGTYCPFTREIRVQLMSRPPYQTAHRPYEKHAAARTRVLAAKALAISKKRNEVPKELLDTITYYSKK